MLHTARIHLFLLFAKELLKAQGNIIYRDILRQRKAPQDLICMASVLGKLKTSSCYLRDKNRAMDTYAIQWRTAKCLPVRKIFFGVAFNRCLEDTIFLCGLLFQKPTLHRTARTSIYQRNAQELTKEQL